jgi:hypothetical protein
MKTILIDILSTSIGDTIASTPYVSEYQKKITVKFIIKYQNENWSTSFSIQL